jgi:RNA polymerase sigma-70 factor (ECF subfamily)
LLADEADPSDASLLERFIAMKDEAAFAGLVRRHGPMVWGVCCRLLPCHQDAEDAFQATFLVLVRKATSIASRELLANWLYGVAQRTAMRARTVAARRHSREKQVMVMPEVETAKHDLWDDLQALLDRELSELPKKYRAPIVLCDLEGKTRKQAARQLGVPEGTVAGRLARARALLARRLSRHGLPLSSAALAAMLTTSAAAAAVPLSVASAAVSSAIFASTGQGAATGAISAGVTVLVEGVLKAMLLARLTLATAMLLTLAVIGLAAGFLTYGLAAEQPPNSASKGGPGRHPVGVRKGPGKARSDQDALLGTWMVDQTEHNGKHQLNETLTGREQIWKIAASKITIRYGDGTSKDLTYRLVPDKTPKAIDVTISAEGNYRYLGIYALDGDTLKFAYSRNVHPAAERPKAFESREFLEDRGRRFFVLHRIPNDQPASQKSLWTLDFKVSRFRAIKALIPGRGPRTIWYVCYEIVNNTQEPVRFVPEFYLWSDKGTGPAPDELILTAQERIRAAEDPAGKMDIKNSVTISSHAIAPGKKVQGLALWDGIDPAAAGFTLYARGLSNGYFVEENKTYYKTLEVRLQRDGDDVRPNGPAEWSYRQKIRNK